MKWNERICYMLKYGVIPLLSNFKKSTSQSVPRSANLNMDYIKRDGIKKRFAKFDWKKKCIQMFVCIQALDTEILKSDSTQLGFRADISPTLRTDSTWNFQALMPSADAQQSWRLFWEIGLSWPVWSPQLHSTGSQFWCDFRECLWIPSI